MLQLHPDLLESQKKKKKKRPECRNFVSLSDEDEADEPSILRFMCAELTRGYFLEHNEAKYTERRERVYTCMRIPKELEKVGLTHTLSHFLSHTQSHTLSFFCCFFLFPHTHLEVRPHSFTHCNEELDYTLVSG